MKTVRTRIAPSPTGFPHIGTIYQVLFDWAFAKKYNGKFIVRIEDTDRQRLVEGAEEVIFNSLEWFALTADEDSMKGGPYGPYRQSERLPIYQKHAQELIEKGHAYYCFCTKERLDEMRAAQIAQKKAPMYDGHCVSLSKEEVAEKLTQGVTHVVRMKVPKDETISFSDLIGGEISFESNVIDQQVIIKSDGYPTYHFAVVVDDHLMEISHIFRGKEWISSTPKHVLLYRYFGWEMPQHAHLPLILNADGKGKLSKRHGHASVNYYREQGYLPQAVLNYLSNIVWNHPHGKEIYPLSEFIELLDISTVTSAGSRFDLTKLDWINGEYIRAASVKELMPFLAPFTEGASEELVMKLIPLAKERMKKLSEFSGYIKPFLTFTKPELDSKYTEFIPEFKKVLNDVGWTHAEIEKVCKQLVAEKSWSMRDSFMALRISLTGEKIGLPLFETMEILGKDEVMKRLTAYA